MKAPLNYYLHKIIPRHLPITWIFFVTYKCNSRCRHCFWEELNKKGNELTLEEIEKISKNLGKFDNLLISGGEPILREDVAEICYIFFRNSRIKHIHFPTNGLDPIKTYEVAKDILKKCKNIRLNIGLPLDGLQKTNDYLRGINGSFERVAETTKKLAELKNHFPNLTTYIITVVSNVNYDEVVPLAEYVKKLPVDAHGPSPLRGLPKDTTLKPPTSAQWEKLAKDLSTSRNLVFRKDSFKNKILSNRIMSIYKAYSRIMNGECVVPCVAGDLVGVIEPNGDVRMCELSPIIGNLRDTSYDIKKMWFSKEATLARGKLKNCACTHCCFLSPSKDICFLSFFKSLFGY